LAGGAGVGAVAMGTSGDLDTCRANPACIRTEREVAIAGDVGSQAMVADILLVTGMVTLGVGAALYFLSRTDQATNAAFIVAPAPGGAVATGLFRF
jgi:hypothetical protein